MAGTHQAAKREAIVYVPGIHALFEEQGYSMNSLLLRGLTKNAANADVREVDEIEIQGQRGKQIRVEFYDGEVKTIDIFEVFWGDIVKRLSTASLKDRLFQGLNLFFYWLFSKIWLVYKEAPNLTFGFTASVLLILLWYYGTISMALIAIGDDPTGFLGSQMPPDWAKMAKHLGEMMGGWSVWLTTSALLTFVPVNMVVDTTHFAQNYLQDAIDDSTGEAIRLKLRKRVFNTLNSVMAEDYDQITLLAHSFGVIFCTELLADSHTPLPKPVRYVTLGGQLQFLALRAAWISDLIPKCLKNSAVEQWTDYYSDRDWACTRTHIADDLAGKFESCKIMRSATVWESLSNKMHTAYFYDRIVIEQLLNHSTMN